LKEFYFENQLNELHENKHRPPATYVVRWKRSCLFLTWKV
jgi:hypothetical protein